ncbi:MAG: Spy/CpxP family protein refolding chaperone [Proteobacteria bacterium]|nr:Spy/CpxP family protein refolding chaperone [Pseudomonadota bacterium]
MQGAQHVEGRLAFLKTELKITDSQEGVWEDYAKALRANARQMTEMMKNMPHGMAGTGAMNQGMMGPGMMNQGMMNQGMMGGAQGKQMTVPQRLDWAEQHMAQHMKMLQAMKAPTTALYQALNPAQKQIADQLLISPMGMM